MNSVSRDSVLILKPASVCVPETGYASMKAILSNSCSSRTKIKEPSLIRVGGGLNCASERVVVFGVGLQGACNLALACSIHIVDIVYRKNNKRTGGGVRYWRLTLQYRQAIQNPCAYADGMTHGVQICHPCKLNKPNNC